MLLEPWISTLVRHDGDSFQPDSSHAQGILVAYKPRAVDDDDDDRQARCRLFVTQPPTQIGMPASTMCELSVQRSEPRHHSEPGNQLYHKQNHTLAALACLQIIVHSACIAWLL